MANRPNKENYRVNNFSTDDEPEVVGIINPRRGVNMGAKRPARRNTAENKYNNVRVNLPDNLSSLGPL